MVRVQPLARELQVLAPRMAHLHEVRGRPAEPALRPLERDEVPFFHLRCRDLGRQALELGPDEERLAELVERKHADAHPAVRLEGDEAERGEPPQSLPHWRSRDLELLGQVLLTQDASRRDLPGDDRLLERECEVVRLRPEVLRHSTAQDPNPLTQPTAGKSLKRGRGAAALFAISLIPAPGAGRRPGW